MERQEIQGEISVQHVYKAFEINGKKLEVLRNIDFEIKSEDVVSVIGPSGCGKSTLLRMIAGLDSPTEGKITVSGREVQRPSLDVGVLFQESRLLPWDDVEKNISFGLPEKTPKDKKKRSIRDSIRLVGLEGFEKALPRQLSGGMQKRVAIARTLINYPHVLLLDEPFGALDAFTKMKLQEEVLRICRQEKMTLILVTHDIDEAVYMGNKIIIMSQKPGVIKSVIKVELPEPRNRTGYEFEQTRSRVYREFFGEDVPEDYMI